MFQLCELLLNCTRALMSCSIWQWCAIACCCNKLKNCCSNQVTKVNNCCTNIKESIKSSYIDYCTNKEDLDNNDVPIEILGGEHQQSSEAYI